MKTHPTKTRKTGRAASKRGAAKAARPAAKRAHSKRGSAPAQRTAAPSVSAAKHPTGKLGHVLDGVAAKRGASLDELVKLTGWQPHTARAALTRLRQRGFQIDFREANGRKAYHLVEARPQ
jgi:hypothetical protein